MKPEILRLMRDNFSWSQQADVWHHWAYEQSPYRPNYCWFVETEDQETVGFTGLMARRMKVAERVCDVGQAANLNVQAEHRGTAAAIKLQRALISHVEESDLALAFGITRNAVAVRAIKTSAHSHAGSSCSVPNTSCAAASPGRGRVKQWRALSMRGSMRCGRRPRPASVSPPNVRARTSTGDMDSTHN